jgi:hypothetical protein
MPSHLPAPNKVKWKKYRPDGHTPGWVLFMAEHFTLIGIVLGMLVSAVAWLAVASTGFAVMRINNHESWGIFPILLMIGAVIVAHEVIHFLFSNWKLSRFIVAPQRGAFAVQLGGEFAKWRYVWCLMAPTVLLSLLVIPAFYFDSPFLMAAALLNLGGAGMDWLTAMMAVAVLKSDRIFVDGEDAYQLKGSNGKRRAGGRKQDGFKGRAVCAA